MGRCAPLLLLLLFFCFAPCCLLSHPLDAGAARVYPMKFHTQRCNCDFTCLAPPFLVYFRKSAGTGRRHCARGGRRRYLYLHALAKLLAVAHTHTGRTGRRCPPLRGAQPQAADHAHERRGGGDAPQDGRVAGASVVRHAENEWPDGGRRHVGGLQDAWIRVRVRVQLGSGLGLG